MASEITRQEVRELLGRADNLYEIASADVSKICRSWLRQNDEVEQLKTERKGKALISLEQLRNLEWSNWNTNIESPACPICYVEINMPHGKDKGCWLAQKIEEASDGA